LIRLVENSTLRQQLGQRGRLHVLENYRWEDCVSQIVELYQEAARQQIPETRSAA
jgi:glycosyltransferase involved in cell wall biosynthesis